MSLFGVKPKHDRMNEASPSVLMDAKTGQMPTAQRVIRVKLTQRETTLFGKTISMQSVSHQLHSAARSAVTKVGHVAKKVATSKPAKVAAASVNMGSGNAINNVLAFEGIIRENRVFDDNYRHEVWSHCYTFELPPAGVANSDPLAGFDE